MKYYLAMTFLGAGILLASCSSDSVDYEAEKIHLMELSREWSGIVNSGDIDAIVSHWDENAVLLPPGSPMIEGRDAIRAYVESSSAIPGFSITWEPERAFISNSGDMAYMIERNEVTFNDQDGELVEVPGKVVTIWKKDSDGEWKNVIDMWNSVTPAAD